LVARGSHLLRPEPEDEAWAWALRPVHGASSLLIPAGQSEDDRGYLSSINATTALSRPTPGTCSSLGPTHRKCPGSLWRRSGVCVRRFMGRSPQAP
jgi:hypothetical protein